MVDVAEKNRVPFSSADHSWRVESAAKPISAAFYKSEIDLEKIKRFLLTRTTATVNWIAPQM
jgi:hypothetical protein